MISGKVENVSREADSWPKSPVPEATGEEIGTQSEPASLTAKPSLAIPIWLAVIVGVLAALWLQTRIEVPSYNFLIEGNADSQGATVVVDGQPVGKLELSDNSGIKVVDLKMHVSDGMHSVIVTKPGYKQFSSRLLLRGEDYISVDLKSVDLKDK